MLWHMLLYTRSASVVCRARTVAATTTTTASDEPTTTTPARRVRFVCPFVCAFVRSFIRCSSSLTGAKFCFLSEVSYTHTRARPANQTSATDVRSMCTRECAARVSPPSWALCAVSPLAVFVAA